VRTTVNAVWDAELQAGQRVAVVGAGTVGILTAWCARQLARCEVTLIDINPRRAAIAEVFGLSFATPVQAAGLSQQMNRIFHTSGTESGLRLALELAAFEATIIEMSWYGTRAVSLPLGQSFHALRLTLKSSQVGSVATSRRGTVSADARLAYALSLLDAPVLDTLINSECDFADLPARMHQLLDAPGDVLCHRINYP
jgi:threonine dehydrogenase-like Zn-dependent dehydrogenase